MISTIKCRTRCGGPDISGLDMANIVTYVRPDTQMKADWNDVPDDIKDTL